MAKRKKKKKKVKPIWIVVAVLGLGSLVVGAGATLALTVYFLRKPKPGEDPTKTSQSALKSQEAKVDAAPVVTNAGLSLQAEAGSASYESGIETTPSKALDYAEGLVGLDLGLGSGFTRSELTSKGAIFPPSYPSKTSVTLDLQEPGAAASWTPQVRSEVLLQHDRAMAPIYDAWKGLQLAREWLGAAGVPLIYSNTKLDDRRFQEGLRINRMLSLGTAVRMAPAIVTFDPKVAKRGGAIWIPPEEPPTYGPNSISGIDRKYQLSTLKSAVWDGSDWRTIPWNNFGLDHRIPNTGIYPGDNGTYSPTGLSLQLVPGDPKFTGLGDTPRILMALGGAGRVRDRDLSMLELPFVDRDMIMSILGKTFG